MTATLRDLWTAAPRSDSEGAARLAIEQFWSHWTSLKRAPRSVMPLLRTFLDRPNSTLQPRVALVDVAAPGEMILRLYAATRESEFGKFLTGRNALDIYADSEKTKVWTNCHRLTAHPCGWLTERVVTSTDGIGNRQYSINLPLLNDRTARPCFANYTFIFSHLEPAGTRGMVNWVAPGAWIDIGAGIPAAQPAG